MNNSSYMSGQWPKVWVLDVRVLALWLLAAVAQKLWSDYWKFAMVVTVLFVLAQFFNMNVSMFLRFLRGRVVGQIKKAYPMDQRGTFLAICLLLLPVMTGVKPSFAEYELVDSVKYGMDWQRGYPGTRDEDVVEGFQDDMPLITVLETLLPQDVVLLWGDGVKKERKVSWKGPKPWGHVLGQIARKYKYRLELQRSGNRLIVENATVGAFVYNHVTDNTNTRLLGLTNKNWYLQKDKKLFNNLTEWAATEGWTIAWGLDREYIIDVDAKYTGSLVSAIRDVVRSYRIQGEMGRVKIKPFTVNKTISIYQVGERGDD